MILSYGSIIIQSLLLPFFDGKKCAIIATYSQKVVHRFDFLLFIARWLLRLLNLLQIHNFCPVQAMWECKKLHCVLIVLTCHSCIRIQVLWAFFISFQGYSWSRDNKLGMHRVEIAVHVAHSTTGGLRACSPEKILKIWASESAFEAIRDYYNPTK